MAMFMRGNICYQFIVTVPRNQAMEEQLSTNPGPSAFASLYAARTSTYSAYFSFNVLLVNDLDLTLVFIIPSLLHPCSFHVYLLFIRIVTALAL